MIDVKSLWSLIERNEWDQLKREVSAWKAAELTIEQMKIWILYLARFENYQKALVLAENKNLDDDLLKARIFNVAGEYQLALEHSTDPMLTAIILNTTGEFQKAREALADHTCNGEWFYEIGRSYGREGKFERAVWSLEQAVEAFEEEGDSLMRAVALSNVANYQFKQAYFDSAEENYNLAYDIVKDDFDEFPESKTSVLLSYSYFLNNRGLFTKSYKVLMQAKALIENRGSAKNLQRLELRLAYIYRSLGYNLKSVKILTDSKGPYVFQKREALRALGESFSNLGQYKKALAIYREAHQMCEPGNVFYEVYLPLSEARTMYKVGMRKQAIALCKRIYKQALQLNDLEAKFYVKGIWAELTGSVERIEQSLDYHNTNGFFSEAQYNHMALAKCNLKAGNWKWARRDLRLVSSTNPVVMGEKAILSGIVAFQLGDQAMAIEYVERAYEILKGRSHRELKLLSLYLLLNWRYDSAEMESTVSDFEDVLSKCDTDVYKNVLYTVRSYGVRFRKLRYETEYSTNVSSLLSKHRWVHSKKSVVIDATNKSVYSDGAPVEVLKKHPRLAAILFLMAKNPKRLYSKEDLVTQAFERSDYDARTDDNLVYVSMNRLKKHLKPVNLIECVDGKYRFSEGCRVVAIDTP